MGFEHDEFKQPFDKMSRLDHIFCCSRIISDNASAFGDMDLVKKRQYPSDHLMIVCNIVI